jgi:hypothetical protein
LDGIYVSERTTLAWLMLTLFSGLINFKKLNIYRGIYKENES